MFYNRCSPSASSDQHFVNIGQSMLLDVGPISVEVGPTAGLGSQGNLWRIVRQIERSIWTIAESTGISGGKLRLFILAQAV